jgi:hypothetical protein
VAETNGMPHLDQSTASKSVSIARAFTTGGSLLRRTMRAWMEDGIDWSSGIQDFETRAKALAPHCGEWFSIHDTGANVALHTFSGRRTILLTAPVFWYRWPQSELGSSFMHTRRMFWDRAFGLQPKICQSAAMVISVRLFSEPHCKD